MKQFITYILLFSSVFVLAQKAQFANAKLDAATVYFNSAELTIILVRTSTRVRMKL